MRHGGAAVAAGGAFAFAHDGAPVLFQVADKIAALHTVNGSRAMTRTSAGGVPLTAAGAAMRPGRAAFQAAFAGLGAGCRIAAYRLRLTLATELLRDATHRARQSSEMQERVRSSKNRRS
jgi:hypothetical protein